MKTLGIHHITAITSDPQINIDFYSSLLGLRLVKVTVNFDDPGSYHLYYGDLSGKPGSALTFFAWPGAQRGTTGSSHLTVTSFAAPIGATIYWLNRLAEAHVPAEKLASGNGIRFKDPDGMNLEIIEHEVADEFTVWEKSPVPAKYQLLGFVGATLSSPRIERTSKLLTETLGMKKIADKTFGFEDSKAFIRLDDSQIIPSRMGGGIVHHIAFRIANDQEQLELLEKIQSTGLASSPVIDRSYFHSIYFREPSGVLFEIATDQPGFTINESVEKLGSSLTLPPWMESRRSEISASLPKLVLPDGTQIP